MKFVIATTVLLSAVIASPASANSVVRKSVDIQRYKVTTSLVKDAWLSLDAVSSKGDNNAKARAHLKQTLISLYQAEHKVATADWIAGMDNATLSKEIQRQKRNGAPDFLEEIQYDLASISRAGVINIRKGGCTAMYIVPESPTYNAFRAAVGDIEPGYLKEIPPLSEKLLNSERLRKQNAHSTANHKTVPK